MSAEILIGRWLAFCAHPCAAWPRLTTRGRTLLVAAYVGLGYAGALAALIVL